MRVGQVPGDASLSLIFAVFAVFAGDYQRAESSQPQKS
jgi:hypothetical protein